MVVLDIDECLIHSKFISEKAARYAHQFPIQSGAGDETGDGESDTDGDELENVVDSFELMLLDGDWVQVKHRPYLAEFLHHVSERFETYVFTAATEVYAKPVLEDMLDPTRTKFTRRWYRDNCVRAKDGAYYITRWQVLHRQYFNAKCIDL